MSQKNEIDLYLLPQQKELVHSTARYTLLSGGVGSGKSYGLIIKALVEMTKQPGIKLLFTDSNWPSLRDTTYRDFFNVVPEVLIQDHNKTVHQVVMRNGSQAIFRAFDDPNKLKRYNFGGVLCEELSDLPEDIFKMARTRIRQIGFKGFFAGATNPNTFQNWVYKYFIESPIPDSKVIFSKSIDNTFLPAEYLEDLESVKLIDPQYYNRMVLGQWGDLAGSIYSLPPAQCIRPAWPFDEIICGVDFGFGHPTAMGAHGVSSGRYATIEEIYKREMTSSDIRRELKQFHEKYNFSRIYCDGARPEIIAELVDDGLPAVAALKGPGSVFAGIMFMKGLIADGNYFCSEDCVHHHREFKTYIWDKRPNVKEQPIKLNDDCMDELRYAIYTHSLENGGYVSADKLLAFQKMI